MIICPNCTAQLSDDALFCGNCGIKFNTAPAQTSRDVFINRVNELCRMANELSLSYVDEMTAMENSIAASNQNCEAEKALAEERQKNAGLDGALREALAELDAVKAEKEALEAETASLRAELDSLRLYIPEQSAASGPAPAALPRFCPECGTAITPDMLFCRECGTKLK